MARPPGPDRPLYVRIAMSLKGRILAGHYRTGERLPSEDELATSLSASRSTIRQALADLRRAGYLTSRRGSGSYVAEELPIEPLSPKSGPVYTGFLDDLDAEANHVQELDRTQEIIAADPDTAARLHIPVGAEVTRYRAVRLRHGIPYGIATDIVPVHVAEQITSDVLRESATVVDALALAGSRVAESLQRVEPTSLTAETADRFDLPPGTPALALTGIAYDADRAPVDAYSLTIIPGYGIGLHLTRATGT
ncbi:GntR family transcriptional regulator [Saccharopolyspora hirsuta]|uniref:GntR family transcriptional regulator n=1 Tax=Saccharopolyspora hirsuta TaxID=1837 RepID=A0A5M7BFG5_SACHI|nr:GntR family transcriptional regulator [Saccharopolyspora hirsuta]KAA5828276.1 GntR family transcriptional regulator [Saccharopolyspora hirsuta]